MKTFAIMLATAALLTACGGGGAHRPTATATPAKATAAAVGERTASGSHDATSALEARFVAVVADVSPAVVQIQTPDGLGSGGVYDAKGDVVTNHHVVVSHTDFTVTLASGERQQASLVGSYAPDDLAVIRLRGKAPGAAQFGDS